MIWNWFRDNWLVTRQAATLFLVSTILVIALTPVLLGRIDTKEMLFWARLPWGVLGVLGPVALFFLWFGMWHIGSESTTQVSGSSECGFLFC